MFRHVHTIDQQGWQHSQPSPTHSQPSPEHSQAHKKHRPTHKACIIALRVLSRATLAQVSLQRGSGHTLQSRQAPAHAWHSRCYQVEQVPSAQNAYALKRSSAAPPACCRWVAGVASVACPGVSETTHIAQCSTPLAGASAAHMQAAGRES